MFHQIRSSGIEQRHGAVERDHSATGAASVALLAAGAAAGRAVAAEDRHQLSAAGAEVSFQDILSCHAALQTYLHIRETSDLYAEIRGTQRLGVPCFIQEDGTMTLDLNDILG